MKAIGEQKSVTRMCLQCSSVGERSQGELLLKWPQPLCSCSVTYRKRIGYLGRREPTYDAMQGWILVNLENLVSLEAFPSGYSPIVWYGA